jgi:hypothetical protein
VEELKQVKDTGDLPRIRSLTEQLQQATNALAQQMYAQGGADGDGMPGGQQSGGRAASDDDVVEGEYRTV